MKKLELTLNGDLHKALVSGEARIICTIYKKHTWYVLAAYQYGRYAAFVQDDFMEFKLMQRYDGLRQKTINAFIKKFDPDREGDYII